MWKRDTRIERCNGNNNDWRHLHAHEHMHASFCGYSHVWKFFSDEIRRSYCHYCEFIRANAATSEIQGCSRLVKVIRYNCCRAQTTVLLYCIYYIVWCVQRSVTSRGRWCSAPETNKWITHLLLTTLQSADRLKLYRCILLLLLLAITVIRQQHIWGKLELLHIFLTPEHVNDNGTKLHKI